MMMKTLLKLFHVDGHLLFEQILAVTVIVPACIFMTGISLLWNRFSGVGLLGQGNM